MWRYPEDRNTKYFDHVMVGCGQCTCSCFTWSGHSGGGDDGTCMGAFLYHVLPEWTEMDIITGTVYRNGHYAVKSPDDVLQQIQG